jgi:hypothetical protein
VWPFCCSFAILTLPGPRKRIWRQPSSCLMMVAKICFLKKQSIREAVASLPGREMRKTHQAAIKNTRSATFKFRRTLLYSHDLRR